MTAMTPNAFVENLTLSPAIKQSLARWSVDDFEAFIGHVSQMIHVLNRSVEDAEYQAYVHVMKQRQARGDE